MGPHHPSTHGVFRMDVALDGELVRKLKPVFGYLHRNHEKIGENTSYLGSMPYTDRLDYFCSMTNNWAYALSVEKLAGHRGSGTRRISAGDPGGADAAAESRVVCSDFLLQDMGARGTPLMYAFREREKILDLVRVAHRLAHDVQLHALWRLPGRCRPDWLERAQQIVDAFPAISRRVRNN